MTSVTLVRQIKARPSTVFELLATADGMRQWWGPDELPVLAAEADPRVGGRFRVRFRTTDGAEHECAGEFLEIEAPARIAMSWRWTAGGEPDEQGAVSRLELSLRPIATGTELTLTHADLRTEVSAASHGEGWSGALGKLQARLEFPRDETASVI